jgi:CHRD domain
MRRRVAAAVLAAALVLGLGLLAAPRAAASGKATTLLAASLNGANEFPGPGDPDGRGRAFVRLAGGKACFLLKWSGISAPTAAHIHPGRAGTAGGVAVAFFQPATNAATLPPTLHAVAGCATVDRALARAIAASPGDYYVNIHTAELPGGAIRGQLRRGGHPDLDLPDQLTARLKGANEVPPADPDGRGLALVRAGARRVCFAAAWTRISPPIFAHIHVGAAGMNGGIVVLFFDVPEVISNGPTATLPEEIAAVAGCGVVVDPAQLPGIRRDPGSYYVNVHTVEFPPGAIRGQLRRVA